VRIANPPAQVAVDVLVVPAKGAFGNSVHTLFLVQRLKK
jgi:hypothetical protein